MEIADEIRWSVRLGDSDPRKRYIVLLVACFAGIVGSIIPGLGFIYGLIGFALVIVSSAELFFPIHYAVTNKKIESRCLLSISSMEWTQIKRTFEDSDGVKLSPFEKSHRMEPFRGVYIRFANNRELVLAKIREQLDDVKRTLEGGTDGGGSGHVDDENRSRDHEAAP